jgi:uncharacterized integral membrane protein
MTFDPNNAAPRPVGGYPPPGAASPPPAAPGSAVPPAPGSAVPPAPAPEPAPARPAGIDDHGRVKRGRVSAIWVGLIIAALLLVALLIFIAQNSKTVAIHFLGFAGHLSLAVALLAAAVIGILVVAIPGTARIVQLRRALKKNL